MLAKKFGIGFGIAVIFPMLLYYGVSTFSPAPKWEDYYGHSYADYNELSKQEKEVQRKENEMRHKNFKTRQQIFQERLFYVSVPLGIAAIVAGAIIAIQAIGAGLIFGGIFALTTGYIGYWSHLQDWMRFVSLLVAFCLLVFVGYKKLNSKA